MGKLNNYKFSKFVKVELGISRIQSFSVCVNFHGDHFIFVLVDCAIFLTLLFQ